MKTNIILYILTWLIPASLVGLYYAGIIVPQGSISAIDGTLPYMLSIVTIILSMLTAYVAMKLFTLPAVKTKFQTNSVELLHKNYNFFCRIRIIAILVVIIINLAVYYLMLSTSNLYLAGIMLIALLFCVPREGELKNICESLQPQQPEEK